MWIKNLLTKNKPILALSPMADMTDSPFCQIVKRIGGADVVFREMVSSEAIVRDNGKTWGMVDFLEVERPIVQQIFGADPKIMARAAVMILAKKKPDGIDINMGCPVSKMVSNFNGCALMKDPDLAGRIVREVKKAIGGTLLSVKIRLGWSDPDEFKTFIPVIEEAGADLLTVHGRTKAQGYSGQADWKRIREAKKIASVPILANGDIHQPSQVSEVLKITGADGVAVARGVLGNPWFFRNYKMKIENKEITSEERVRVVLEHARLHVSHYGKRGIITFRKHLVWYFKTSRIGFDLPGVKKIRGELMRVKSLEELANLLRVF